jgi:4-hydroxybenzoate polyprenyltransferase
VLAPLAFSGRLPDPPSARSATLLAAAFCLLSSGGYAWNDLRDAAADRRHPAKAHRPLASRRLSPTLAAGLGALLLAAGLALGWRVERDAPPLGRGWLTALGPLDWCLLYVGLTVAYTLVLRRVAGLDVLALAAGFVLRAWAGSAALQLEPSRWLLACSFCLSLFLALGKRRLEASQLGAAAGATRPALAGWSVAALDRLVDLAALLAGASYVAYSLAPDTRDKVGGAWLLLSAPIVLWLVARVRGRLRRDAAADPVELLLRDRVALAGLLAWGLVALAVVYRRPW